MEGVVAYTSGNRATSGRDGRYRLANLSAGAVQIEFRVPLELRKKTLHRDPETGEIWGYPAVQFYPGVVDRASATLVQLAAGMELHGFDVRLQRMRLVDFSGRTVTRAGGEALAPAHVRLLTAGPENSPDETLETRAVGGDGSFRFELIRSGSYVLLVYRGDAGTGLPYRVSVEVGQNGVLAMGICGAGLSHDRGGAAGQRRRQMAGRCDADRDGAAYGTRYTRGDAPPAR